MTRRTERIPLPIAIWIANATAPYLRRTKVGCALEARQRATGLPRMNIQQPAVCRIKSSKRRRNRPMTDLGRPIVGRPGQKWSRSRRSCRTEYHSRSFPEMLNALWRPLGHPLPPPAAVTGILSLSASRALPALACRSTNTRRTSAKGEKNRAPPDRYFPGSCRVHRCVFRASLVSLDMAR